MKFFNRRTQGLLCALVIGITGSVYAQNKLNDSSAYYNEVRTYVNPVLPGDHPDPTLLKVGNDFYHCGSSFHFNPYLPIYHSTDLVHWEVISRVVPLANAGKITDRPSAGIWQGAITYFYGSYWVYFSSNGQWFSKSNSPKGPWSAPVQVKTNSTTGPLGYDNSIFVDDDGKPYMVIKNGQKTNRLQALGRDGQLTDSVINLDWINAKLQYSWAEGPVMCKRNGYYYYFPAGDVSGGQYALRASALTADSTKWERLGNFFKPTTDPKMAFRVPNHIAAPVQLADGTWWTIGQSYEKLNGDDWSGMGRQTSLYRVIWEGDRPWGVAGTSTPVEAPLLPRSGIRWRSVQSDYFNSDSLSLGWHFLNRTAAASYSLQNRKGWIRLTPGSARTHLMQKETDHYYTAVTRVDLNATDTTDKAGIYLTNGNQKVFVRFYSGQANGKEIVLECDTAIRRIPNTMGNVIWLKLERKEHLLTGYCSADGKTWQPVGAPVSAVPLDKVHPNFNSWVGTSVGLFAEGKPADFDFFICKDALSPLPVAGLRNYFGIRLDKKGTEKCATNTSDKGGWLMLSGVEFGNMARQINVTATSSRDSYVEIWLDDLKSGRKIATVSIKKTADGNTWNQYHEAIKKVSGQHDVFIKFPAGGHQEAYIRDIQFSAGE
jgi:xylan 1,4-beta-xylosidase